MSNGLLRGFKDPFGAPLGAEEWNDDGVPAGQDDIGYPDDIIVTGPDGQLYAFPAGTSPVTIAGKMRQLAGTNAGNGVFRQAEKQAVAWPDLLQQETTALQMGQAHFASYGIPVPAWDPARPAPPFPDWTLPPAQRMHAIADYTSYMTSNPRQHEVDPFEGFMAGMAHGVVGNALEVGVGTVDREAARGFRRDYETIEEAQPWSTNAGEWAGGLLTDLGGPVVAGIQTVLGWIADAIVGGRPDVAQLIMDQSGITADQLEQLMPPAPGRDWLSRGADLVNEAIDARDVAAGNPPDTLPQVTAIPYPPGVGPNDGQLFASAVQNVYDGDPVHDPAALPPAYWFGGVDADLGTQNASLFDPAQLPFTMFPHTFYEERGQEPLLPFYLPADPHGESYFFFAAGTDPAAAWNSVLNWRRARGLY